MSRKMAAGLRAFLNSSMADEYIRQFNGNTQINAADLRYLRYPTRTQLETMGALLGRHAGQEKIDRAVETITG